MAKRKSFNVQEFKDWANSALARPELGQEAKSALCTAVEKVLMDTGNYHGFNSNTWLSGGCAAWEQAGKLDDRTPFLGLEYDRHYF